MTIRCLCSRIHALRRAAKKDARHAEMVADLRKMHFSVIDLSRVGDNCPDMLVGRQGIDVIAEVKTRLTKHKVVSATQYLTDGQRALHERWRGSPIFACFTAEEIVREHYKRSQLIRERRMNWPMPAARGRAAATASEPTHETPDPQAARRSRCYSCGRPY